MARPSVDLAQVEIRPISKDDEIAEFSCGDDADDQDLNDYFRTDALRSRDLGLAHIYVAVVSGKIVGYAALLTDIVRLKTRDITRSSVFSKTS